MTTDDPRHPHAVYINGPGGPTKHRGVVHFGPEPGFCSVDEDGCGYCIGVPCRLPKADETQEGTE